MVFRKSPSNNRLDVYASPFVVVGVAAILAVIVLAMSFYNVNRERAFVSTVLTEKGAMLIRSFEAGARVGMMARTDPETRIQVLTEQFAMLPGIESITLTNMDGVVRASSDTGSIGQDFMAEGAFSGLQADENLKWKVTTAADGTRTFWVYKLFTPLVPPRGRSDLRSRFEHNGERIEEHGEGHGMGRHGRGIPGDRSDRMRRNWQRFCTMMGEPQQSDEVPHPAVLLVGMDVKPFEEARAQDVRTTVILAATLLALGLGGVIALYWSQRLRASRKQLLDARAFSGEVVTHMPIGLVAMDPEGRVTMVNHVAESVLGAECGVAPGERFETCLPPELVAALERVRTGEEIVDAKLRIKQGANGTLPLSISGTMISTEDGDDAGAILLLRDLREIERLEDAVRRAEKLAAIGSLAGGVAHEIRNPLSSIKASATYFGSHFEEGSDGKRMAEIMVQEVERLNRAVTQLLEYARPSELNRVKTSLPALAERSLELVRRDAAAKGVDVMLDATDAPPVVWLDQDRITQALLNLYINAIQAMEEGGKLEVSIDTTSKGDARIQVADNGPGLPTDVLKRVFDPYYTTKSRGAGLGLAIVQKIVEAHGGGVEASSAPGKGAVFLLTLPLGDGQQKQTDGEGEAI